ncbi:chorismate mutase [Croceicoccus ponticola]|uniref:chorismate mutase n=1 Tax=Croceicoccus ponticola TaxID=2217664 RepID=A0A437H109_9SPHN|nr:chorismate mutase [Croceicoccus ponticola]RVQ69223.1 chorismate mutase [Croceicoccus ponticola]
MNDLPKSPDDCETMIEVRAGVDATDRALIELFATRFCYMRAAARIKPTRDAVRDEERKRAVIEAATAHASAIGVPTAVVAEMWEVLVEASIAYEMDEWERLRG